MSPTAPTASALASLVERLDALLPQTQCTRCGYPDCHAYAHALAAGEAAPNRCPPGGEDGAQRLAALLGQSPQALDPAVGSEGPRQLVFIDEARCIGCTLCIQACPVDAIIGAPKRMHAVIEAHCTGCELCLPACPVDCIVLENASGRATGWDAWSPAQADAARARHEVRRARLARDEGETVAASASSIPYPRIETTQAPAPPAAATPPAAPSPDPKRAAIEAALARARARLGT